MIRLTLAVFALLLAAAPSEARVQRDMICWLPDYEFPVDCDEEDE